MALGSSPEDLSYSIFLEEIKKNKNNNNGLDHVRVRNSMSWIPDDSVNQCYSCNINFGWFYRRHHCRACGRIFCANCSSKVIALAKNLDTYPEGPNEKIPNYWEILTFRRRKKNSEQKERVCNKCYDRLTNMYSLEVYILIFGYVDIKTLSQISLVNKEWNRAVNVCKSVFRDIQYLLPGYDLSPLQKRLIWNNRYYLSGHSRWLIKLLSVIDWSNNLEVKEIESIINKNRKCTCWNLMCTRICNNQITSYEWMELLDLKFINSNVVKQLFLKSLTNLADTEFECFIPQLTYSLQYDDSSLLNLLIKKSVANILLRTIIYWNLVILKSIHLKFNSYYIEFITQLDACLGRRIVYDELIKGRKLIKIISRLPADNNEVNTYFETQRDHLGCSIRLNPDDPIIYPLSAIPYPLNPTRKIIAINSYDIKTKQSITYPRIIPLICSNESMDSILFKKECLIQDYIIINIIRIMDSILKRDENIDFGIKTYRVLPLNDKSGIIEIIPDSETLYTITHKLNFTIQNYVLEHNSSLPVDQIRQRFVKSAAAYCVISYLLGVGDRHLDNIMVSQDGFLFHIDYGFILGFDPKPITPTMRITKDIVDAMGGVNSKDFTLFKDYCTRIFNCLRKYIWLFMSMFLIITEDGLAIDSGKYKKDRLKDQFLARFLPSESDNDAKSQLLIKIDDSYQSYTSNVIDFWHYHSKETLTRLKTFCNF